MQHYRLNIIDEILIKQGIHFYLDSSDIGACAYLGEYVKGGGFGASDTNQLIANFKISPTDALSARYKFKKDAIDFFASNLVSVLSQKWLNNTTFIPIPPSKTKSDQEYDNRIIQLLNKMQIISNIELNIRDCINQISSTQADHIKNAKRLSPEERERLYEFDTNYLNPKPNHITVIDDVLTTGSHYRAVKNLLMKTFQGINVYGLFLARRIESRS